MASNPHYLIIRELLPVLQQQTRRIIRLRTMCVDTANVEARCLEMGAQHSPFTTTSIHDTASLFVFLVFSLREPECRKVSERDRERDGEGENLIEPFFAQINSSNS